MEGSAREDLALIRRLMEETRREVVDRGKHFTIWGGISTVGLLVTWWAALGRTETNPSLVWAVLLVVGWAASFHVGLRDRRGGGVRTTGRRLLTGTWVTAAVTLTLVGVAGMFGEVVGYRGLPGVLSAVIAMPIWLTSQLTGERWLGWVAAGWWVGAAVMLFVPGVYTLPLMAAMSLVLLAIPGGVLNARAGRSRPVSPAGNGA